MILVSLGIGAATFFGMVAQATPTSSWCSSLRARCFRLWNASLRQPGVSWVGQQCIVFLLVASAFPFSPRAAAVRSGLVMLGGALQIITSSHPAPPSAAATHRLALRCALSPCGAPRAASVHGADRALGVQTNPGPAERGALRNLPGRHRWGEYRNLPPLRLRQRILDTH